MKYIEPESVVVGSCLSLLNLMGIYCWRNNTGALRDVRGRLVRYGLKGSADIIGIMPDGHFIAVECKREGGRIRSEQKEFIEKINAMGGLGCIVHSVEELSEEIKSYKRQREITWYQGNNRNN